MKLNGRFLVALTVLGTVPSAAAAAMDQTLEGDWEYVAAESSNITAVVEQAVSGMNFIVRPIARSRLRKTNEVYRTIKIDHTADQISVRFDAGKAVLMPTNGSTVPWTRDDGETFQVSGAWERAKLTQMFAAADGQRLNTFRMSDAGDALMLEVKLTSEQLTAPLVYTLVYRRLR